MVEKHFNGFNPRERRRDSIHPEGLTPKQEKLARMLFELPLAIRFEDTKLSIHQTLPEAPLSPIYIDLRVIKRFPEARELVAEAYREMLENIKFDLIADIPTAGTTPALLMAQEFGVGMVTPKLKKKDYGPADSWVEGFMAEDKGKRVLPIDDLITNAGTKIPLIQTLRNEGAIVEDVAVLLERGSLGREGLESIGVRLNSVFTLDQLLEIGLRDDILSDRAFAGIKRRLTLHDEYVRSHARLTM